MINRELLKEFLITEIRVIQESALQDNESLLRVLYLALNGLDNLDFGETDEIFAPAKKGSWGKSPATVIRLQAVAVGSVLLLREQGFSAAKAEDMGAKAYIIIEVDTLKKWKKMIASTGNERLREIVNRPTRRYRMLVKFNSAPSLDDQLDEIKKAGRRFAAARAKKSTTKKIKQSK
jgi:hypothetical protein